MTSKPKTVTIPQAEYSALLGVVAAHRADAGKSPSKVLEYYDSVTRKPAPEVDHGGRVFYAEAGKATPDGPWRLERWQATDGKTPVHVILPNSVRSTYSEAKRLHDEEFARTDIRWGIARCPE